MRDYGFGNGITTIFSEALTENAEAMLLFDAMTAEEKQKVLSRAAEIDTIADMKAYLDELVGFEIGHPPYQL